MDVADRGGNVAPLLLFEHRMPFPLEQLDIGVMPDHDVEVTQGGYLFEKRDVARVEPVVATGDDHLRVAARAHCSCAVGDGVQSFV